VLFSTTSHCIDYAHIRNRAQRWLCCAEKEGLSLSNIQPNFIISSSQKIRESEKKKKQLTTQTTMEPMPTGIGSYILKKIQLKFYNFFSRMICLCLVFGL